MDDDAQRAQQADEAVDDGFVVEALAEFDAVGAWVDGAVLVQQSADQFEPLLHGGVEVLLGDMLVLQYAQSPRRGDNPMAVTVLATEVSRTSKSASLKCRRT